LIKVNRSIKVNKKETGNDISSSNNDGWKKTKKKQEREADKIVDSLFLSKFSNFTGEDNTKHFSVVFKT